MEKEFWLNKWDINQIGFHKEKYNADLVKFWPEIANENSLTTILVPLCGKSKDMLYLASQGHKVIGVELSKIAAKGFFEDNKIDYQVESNDDYTKYYNDQITILVTDLLKIDLGIIHSCDGLYDRASIVALPLDMRKQYIALLEKLPKLRAGMIIAMTFDDNQTKVGPPFSMTTDDISNLFSTKPSLTQLAEYTEVGDELTVHKDKVSKRVEFALKFKSP